MVNISVRCQMDDASFLQGMADYIEKLKAQEPETAKKEARDALIRTGVLTEDGKVKESIVSWE